MIKTYELKTDRTFLLCSYNTESRKCKIIKIKRNKIEITIDEYGDISL